MIIDKDTGKMYDIRNDKQVNRLTNYTTQIKSSKIVPSGSELGQSEMSEKPGRKTMVNSAWGDWWKEKKKSNQEFLLAAEVGDLEKLKKLMDGVKM